MNLRPHLQTAVVTVALTSVAFVSGRLTKSADPELVPPVRVTTERTTSDLAPTAAGKSEPARDTVPEKHPVLDDFSNDADVLAGLLVTPAENLVPIAEGIGRLAALDAGATSRAWQSLARRSPRSDYVGSLVAAYLWSRQAAIDPNTPLPEGWGLDSYPALKASIVIRPQLGQIRADLLAGKQVPYAERRMFFEEAISKDPVGSFSVWLKNHTEETAIDELPWFHRAMENAEHRAGLLTAMEGSSLDPKARAEFLAQLIGKWTAADPAGVEAWLNDPRLGPYKARLRIAYADIRVRQNPQAAWSLSQELPRDARLAAQFSASLLLAQQDPRTGIQRLKEMTDSQDREEVMKTFGETLAIYHYDDWQKWRDTLPREEQDKVNEAAFESWVASDTPAALQWLETRPPGPRKLAMISEFASRFSADNPADVAAWIRTMPDANDRLTAAVAGLRGMSETEHDSIRKLLEAAR